MKYSFRDLLLLAEKEDWITINNNINALSEQDFNNLLLDEAAQGISTYRKFVPVDMVGDIIDGVMKWHFITKRGWYEIIVRKLEDGETKC